MPRILIVHYHLHPGGVTRVIESQVQALQLLKPPPEVIVVAGHSENPQFFYQKGVPLYIEEALNYLDPKTNWRQEYEVLTRFFGTLVRADDILHVHNLNLGKNPLLTRVVLELASQGIAVVNHAHDFAEDRSKNYQFLQEVLSIFTNQGLDSTLYPSLPHLGHAVLNTTDYHRLMSYGVPGDRVFLLPNPVVAETPQEETGLQLVREKICAILGLSADKKIVTYPVRVIRRKNIGEYILFCMLLQKEAHWLVTLPPKNPEEKTAYDRWVDFCSQEAIPLCFEAGTSVSFADLIRSSDFCFTTSVQEGFGMTFMEPWLMGTPVIGRKLENSTADLEQSGIQFPLLYTTLMAPEGQDFSQLTQEHQMQVIRQLKNDQESREAFLKRNAFISDLLNSIAPDLIESNRQIIARDYSIESYAHRLEKLYQKIAR